VGEFEISPPGPLRAGVGKKKKILFFLENGGPGRPPRLGKKRNSARPGEIDGIICRRGPETVGVAPYNARAPCPKKWPSGGRRNPAGPRGAVGSNPCAPQPATESETRFSLTTPDILSLVADGARRTIPTCCVDPGGSWRNSRLCGE